MSALNRHAKGHNDDDDDDVDDDYDDDDDDNDDENDDDDDNSNNNNNNNKGTTKGNLIGQYTRTPESANIKLQNLCHIKRHSSTIYVTTEMKYYIL